MQNTKAYIMLVCATLFWAGNFTIGKFAYLEDIPPYTLAFLRWCLVWIILLPFTYKEISKLRDHIKKNLSLFLILGSTSVCIFSSFTYNALNYTQVINASLFNTAIPVTIILVCFLLKIEKTNIFQISGLLISVLGILAIITRLDFNISLNVKGNKMIHTNDHRKNTNDIGGIFSKKANFPTIKFPAQNNVAHINII